MAESYPLPTYAVSAWVAGDDLLIAFPGTGPNGQGHTIRLPATEGGLRAAITIMRQRGEATDLKLSQRGTPSQYEVERALIGDPKYRAILGAMAEAKTATKAERDQAAALLEELGL